MNAIDVVSNPLSGFLSLRLHDLVRALDAQAEAILSQKGSVSLWEWRLLLFVGTGDQPTIEECAKRQRIPIEDVEATADQLAERDLLWIEENGEDAPRLFLTTDGLEVFADTLPTMRNRQAALYDALSSDELTMMIAILDKLEAVARR